MATTFRGTLIGCGFFADNHLNAWNSLPDAELVAVCDIDGEKAARTASTHSIRNVYTDAATMLESERPDFVDIVTTAPSHRPLVELACRSGVRVILCQKPFAENLDDARAMVDAAEASGAQLIIHENFRWQKGFVEMKQRIEAGQIGKPHFARFQFRSHYDVYRDQPYLRSVPRFLIFDIGLHLFDLARHFMGEVEQVTCHTQRLNPDVAGEDAFTTLLRHTGGAISLVDASYSAWRTPETFPQTLATIEGETGTLELTAGYELHLHTSGKREIIDVEPAVQTWGDKPWQAIQDSVVRFNTHALAVLHGTAAPAPSGADNLKTLSLALTAYDSAEKNCS